jgi:hypothetical protein
MPSELAFLAVRRVAGSGGDDRKPPSGPAAGRFIKNVQGTFSIVG